MSHRASGSSMAGLQSKKPSTVQAAEMEFNLATVKARVLKIMDERAVSNLFKRFYMSDLCDRFLRTFLLYFASMFQMDWIIKTMERSRKQHLEGFNPAMVANRIRELSEEVAALRMDVSPMYAELLLKYASYDKGQQDRHFFETFYNMLIMVLDESFQRLNKKADIEREIGAIFRTKHFNLYKRRNMPPRSVDTLAVKELYALKHETANRVLNARMLASLFEKPPSIGVTVASVSNSPLISQFITSPIVARSMLKDPEQRQKMVDDMARASAHKNTMSSQSPRRGGVPGSPSPEASILEDQVSLPSTRIPSGAAQETAGLPLDDSINYLLMIKRSVKSSQLMPDSLTRPTPIDRPLSGSMQRTSTHHTASSSRGGMGLGGGSMHQPSFDASTLPTRMSGVF